MEFTHHCKMSGQKYTTVEYALVRAFHAEFLSPGSVSVPRPSVHRSDCFPVSFSIQTL